MTAPFDIPPAWRAVLAEALASPEVAALADFLAAEAAAGHEVYPPRAERFAALAAVAPEGVRAVILGQDPYHGPGEAHGLAFSVRPGVAIPGSLANIRTEVARDLGVTHAPHGSLEGWAAQGVLLLNTVLTVRRDVAGSHAGRGWEVLTTAIVRHLGAPGPARAFLLWGKPAGRFAPLVAQPPHRVLETSHPSGLSAWRGFRGCGHFSDANAFLVANGRRPVDWAIPPLPDA